MHLMMGESFGAKGAVHQSPTSMKAPTYSTFTKPLRLHAPHPQQQAWCLSRLLLSWVTPLMTLGHRKQLDADDVWALQPPHQAKVVSREFSRKFEANQSMIKTFFSIFGWRFVGTGLAFLVAMLCNLVGPIALKRVVSSLTARETFSVENVTLWVGLLFASQILQAVADNAANFGSELIAIQLMASVKTLLYRKTLRLSAASRKDMSTGEITNIYTSDSDSVMAVAYLVHQLWLIPLQIICVSYLLVGVLGVAAFAGIGMIILMLGVNHLLTRHMFGLQRIYRKSKDVRMKRVTECFKAIGIVKFNAWEDRFMKRINEARVVEMKDLFARRLWVSVSIMLLWGMPVFISIASFGTYAGVLHRDLTPAVVFTSIALFQLIQGPLRQVTVVLTTLVQSKVAFERISEFLAMDEIDSSNVFSTDAPGSETFVSRQVIVSVENGDFAWNDGEAASLQLRGINLQVKVGDFVVIHGTVGCGKSSLCSALLGEMVKRNGSVFVGGNVAFCSQQPWIQNLTVRDNITFGLPFERSKYNKVLEACALIQDLGTLPAGDLTEIGERGVNVSGGQKARIALARACYSDASVYILDSPLSAVDAIVQNEIFHKCLLGLLRNKTILLVTHNPDIIASPYITHAVTINELGTLVQTHETETRAVSSPLVSPLAARAFMRKSYRDDDDEHAQLLMHNAIDANVAMEDMAEVKDEIEMLSPYKESKIRTYISHTPKPSKQEEIGRLIAEEDRAEGRVHKHVFSGYYHAVGGFPIAFLFVFSSVIWQGLQIASDFWLGAWSNDDPASGGPSTPSASYRLSIYSALGITSASMVLVRMLMIAFYGLRAAQRLFDSMTHALMHAPMRFFDTNPIGRILTRYGGDVSVVDMNVPPAFGRLAGQVFSVGCSAVTAAIVIRWKGLFLIPIVFMYYRLGAFYIRPARELQRLSKTTQAPVLNHLSESVDGGAVVRAYGAWQVDRFLSTNYARLDANNQIWYAQLCVSQWFSLRIQFVGSLLVLVVTTSLVLLRDTLDAAVIGLAFSYALNVSQNLEKLVQVVSQVESLMVSPERVQEYIEVEQEAAYRLPTVDPLEDEWPLSGAIRFENVSFRYKEHDRLVLHDLSLSIKGGEKIGIVGRTGAGKTSLTMALFRINELAGGRMVIDDVDVSKIGLKVLRENMSIIPQSPVLFKGTLRNYLDPFGDFSDDELWASVRQVGLLDRITIEPKRLECQVEDHGENFSVGERQMLCMGRALLRHSRIVIFDEATAAMDHTTDQLLQGVIRTAFAQATVLTIAHRLDTVLDSDRVLVLENGRVADFAPPKKLIERGDGPFFSMMREGGYLDKQPTETTE